jgi:hypothetical protein
MPRTRRSARQSTKEKLIDIGWVAAQLIGLFVFSYINSTKFDQTELKMLGEFAGYWALLSKLRGFTSS